MGKKHWWLVAAGLVALLVLFTLPASERLPLLRSLAVGSLAAVTALVFGVFYAFALSRWRVPGARLLVGLGVAPLVVPPYLAAIGWVDAFGPAGRFPRLLGMQLPRGPSLLSEGLVYTTPSCGFLLGCSLFPLVFLTTRAALQRVPASALEAARLARGRAGEARLLLTSAAPQALAAALFVFALGSVEFAAPQLLRVSVLAEAVTLKMSAEYDPGGAMKFKDVELLAASDLFTEEEKELMRWKNAAGLFRLGERVGTA